MPNQQTQTTSADGERLKPIEYIGYALGDTASGFFFQTFNIFLTCYYVDVWGIPATVLLWLIPAVRAFGAFDDAIMGLLHVARRNTQTSISSNTMKEPLQCEILPESAPEQGPIRLSKDPLEGSKTAHSKVSRLTDILLRCWLTTKHLCRSR
jgi:hypothetical protein